ncbi:MAG: NUDIX domain-containing protein [Acholeplasmataceae bacterium]|jgi:dUTP pyrophosphatase
MMIIPRIIEDDLIFSHNTKRRETIRAIIFNEHRQILMVYSKLFNDYTFPGGGKKLNETDEDTMKRELSEEIGAINIHMYDLFGSIEELRYGLKDNGQTYLQTSRYYIVDVSHFGKPHLVGRENLHELSIQWISIEDAIKHNLDAMKDEKHQQKGLKTVLRREIHMLNTLKETKIYEKI